MAHTVEPCYIEVTPDTKIHSLYPIIHYINVHYIEVLLSTVPQLGPMVGFKFGSLSTAARVPSIRP